MHSLIRWFLAMSAILGASVAFGVGFTRLGNYLRRLGLRPPDNLMGPVACLHLPCAGSYQLLEGDGDRRFGLRPCPNEAVLLQFEQGKSFDTGFAFCQEHAPAQPPWGTEQIREIPIAVLTTVTKPT